jgi:hypothetical protein
MQLVRPLISKEQRQENNIATSLAMDLQNGYTSTIHVKETAHFHMHREMRVDSCIVIIHVLRVNIFSSMEPAGTHVLLHIWCRFWEGETIVTISVKILNG